MALIYASLNEPALAEESFRRALQLNGRDADTMHNYGWFLCQQRPLKDAEFQFQAAVGPDRLRGRFTQSHGDGGLPGAQQPVAEAERSLSKAYEFDPAQSGHCGESRGSALSPG